MDPHQGLEEVGIGQGAGLRSQRPYLQALLEGSTDFASSCGWIHFSTGVTSRLSRARFAAVTTGPSMLSQCAKAVAGAKNMLKLSTMRMEIEFLLGEG